jgi:hypothetical protein
MPDTEKNESPSSLGGSTKPLIVWHHRQSPIFPGTQPPSPSNPSISTGCDRPGDNIKPVKLRSTPSDSAPPPGVTTTPSATLVPSPNGHHAQAQSSFYRGIFTRGVTKTQGATLLQHFTYQSSAPVAQVGGTTPMDITDSWMRRHIATSVILSASPSSNNPLRGSSPTHPGLPPA